jgi:bifunctional DNA-binding transcriptional regulator/antitoxin component of YhaV-PrlF toxin-antitoxin module
MDSVTTAVHIDDQGRLTIPKPARRQLGIVGEAADAEVEVRVYE